MGLDRQTREKATQKVKVGTKTSTSTLDGTTTEEDVAFHTVAEKVSWQSSGDLAGTIEFSINGTDFFGSVAVVANTPASYSTHNTCAVKVTRTSGSGKLHIAIK